MDWAAQVGYLSSPPEGGKQSRLDALIKADLPVPVPDLESDLEQRVTDVLRECGTARSGGMGPQPITATDVKDWMWGTGADLTQWEFALVLSASRSFVGGYQSDNPPYEPLLTKMALASAAAMLG